MNCEKCNSQNSADAKFCHKCGSVIKNNSTNVTGSVDIYFQKQEFGCQICGDLNPTRQVTFYQNIGYIVGYQYSSIKGRLCKKCINNEFKKRTLTTLFLGWWSGHSLFIAPYYLISNLINYLPTIGMKDKEN